MNTPASAPIVHRLESSDAGAGGIPAQSWIGNPLHDTSTSTSTLKPTTSQSQPQPQNYNMAGKNSYQSMKDNAKLLEAPYVRGPQVYDSAAYSDENDDVAHYNDFTKVYGRIPFKKPNVRTGHEREDLAAYINGRQEQDPIGSCLGYCCWLLPVAGWCYLYNKMILVEQGEYGFSLNNGRPEILLPDRHFLNNPLNLYVGKFSIGDDKITVGPVTLVRVAQGKYGLAWNNSVPEILLPGVHVRKNAAFKFERFEPLDSDLIIHGPIKFLIVKSGHNQICYDAGKVQILPQGRYAFSNPSFRVGNTIETQQQNTRFSKHPVLLDGGIGLLVEGLLTYQVVDVERLITQLGDSDLAHAIEDVTKAEIARVFAGIHLEQISTATTEAQNTTSPKPTVAVTGPEEVQHVSAEGHSRTLICQQIIQYVTPLVETWGVRIVTFQLESTKIADEQYAAEYEQASLGMAKAKATLRSVDAENDILVRKATALANAVRIEAEGKKQSMIIAAKGDAEARILDAASRNEAAELMTDSYGRDFALAQQQVAFAGALKANVLTVLPDSVVGKQLSIQPTNGVRR